MQEEDKRPTCPKCGTPARVLIVKKARVRAVLNADGTRGEILSFSRERDPSEVVSYECGGGHVW